MRTVFLLTALTVLALPALAQTPPGPVSYASPDDVAAAAERSKAAKSLSAEVLVALPPLRVSVEYRGKPTPASVHEKNNELINVISGSGTLVVGGMLKDEKRRDATNMTGTGIDGGRSYQLVKEAICSSLRARRTISQASAMTGWSSRPSIYRPRNDGTLIFKHHMKGV